MFMKATVPAEGDWREVGDGRGDVGASGARRRITSPAPAGSDLLPGASRTRLITCIASQFGQGAWTYMPADVEMRDRRE